MSIMATVTSAAGADSTPQKVSDSEKTSPIDQKALDQSPSRHPSRSEIFHKVWSRSTEDKNLTLYGFRRFKTSHLVNLRYLEEEISELDHGIYQAGLKLENDTWKRRSDRLGLRWSHRDSTVPALQDTITEPMILRMRNLLKEYGQQICRSSQGHVC